MSTQYSDSELDALVLALRQRQAKKQMEVDRQFDASLGFTGGDVGALIVGFLVLAIAAYGFYSGSSIGTKKPIKEEEEKEKEEGINFKKWVFYAIITIIFGVVISFAIYYIFGDKLSQLNEAMLS